MIAYNKTDSLDRIYADAKAACQAGTIYNLMLSYEFDLGVVDSQFVKLHEAKAKDWQSEQPPNLFFSHGQFFKGEKGVRHVIQELKTKSASRRALLSLISMEHVLGSGDRAIPSFMIVQFGLADKTLYVTAYFRALEVANFLPINLTEIAILISRITREISAKTVRLLVIAFQAYQTPEFHCLEKAQLDLQKRGAVGAAVVKRDVENLVSWLEGKKQHESEIVTDGLEEMVNVVDEYPALYTPAFASALHSALRSLERMKELRASSSEGATIDQQHAKYLKQLQEAINALRGE